MYVFVCPLQSVLTRFTYFVLQVVPFYDRTIVGQNYWNFFWADGEECGEGGPIELLNVRYYCNSDIDGARIIKAAGVGPCQFRIEIETNLACGDSEPTMKRLHNDVGHLLTGKDEPSPLIGKWTASKWSGSARKGGDPDPFNDEKVVVVSKDVVKFPKGTTFENLRILADNRQGVISTPDQETISLKHDRKNDRLFVEFGYDEPATIIYDRL